MSMNESTEEVTGRNTGMAKDILEWVQAIIIALAIGFIIKTFVFTQVLVDGTSMLPTLENGDRLLIYRFMYTPKAGDVVVFRPAHDPIKPYIKRVIAVEGQSVDIDAETSSVYVDGVLQVEPYILEPLNQAGDTNYPITVPKDHIFVMGDNRNSSEDSRRSRVGMVKTSTVMGKAVFRWWPLKGIGTI